MHYGIPSHTHTLTLTHTHTLTLTHTLTHTHTPILAPCCAGSTASGRDGGTCGCKVRRATDGANGRQSPPGDHFRAAGDPAGTGGTCGGIGASVGTACSMLVSPQLRRGRATLAATLAAHQVCRWGRNNLSSYLLEDILWGGAVLIWAVY